nr:hypothetical protein [Polymorphobacter sp.]
MKFLAAVGLLLAAVAAAAQPVPASPPVLAPGIYGAPMGSGTYPAVAEGRADASGYTLYHPANMPAGKLPLVLWGNGGCKDNGLSAALFLREIASQGYFVVANGAPRVERPMLAALPPLDEHAADAPPPITTADETSVAQLLHAIDWAAAANRAGPFAGHIDLSRIAVMGHSCGGLQAIAAAADPRIGAVVIFDSGIYNQPHDVPGRLHMEKSGLARLHTPIAYFLGGPTDIAFANGSDDVARIDHVPAFLGSLPVGHGATFQLANGGEWGRVGVAWLDWQIKHDRAAAKTFVGPDCGLCTASGWTVSRKHFPLLP